MSVMWYGDSVNASIKNAVKAALDKCALELKELSVNQAPVDTGALRRSCTIKETPDGTGRLVGYPESALRNAQRDSSKYSGYYAWYQHEVPMNHPKGGKSKFLTDPFNANIKKWLKVISDAIKEVMK